jgi:signal transduction histidine kinase
MTRRLHSLRLRLILGLLVTTGLACLLFSFLVLLFAYSVEDSLFEQELLNEGVRQQAHWRATGALAQPGADHIRVFRDPAGFPPDLARAFAQDPNHKEFSGDGMRRYHVRMLALPGVEAPVWLVAEVGDRQVVLNLRRKMLGFLTNSALIILLVVGVVGYVLISRATAPLARLAAGVSVQTSPPAPRIVAADYPPNEIGRLAAALEAAFERIRAFVDRERSFTRDISHELRTPLAVIRGAAELIERRPDLPRDVAAPLKRIADAERRMEETVTLLLALAREEGGDAPRERVLLAPLVEAAVLAASDRFGGRDRDVSIGLPQTAAACLNRAGFILILDNLIGNAFQHAADDRLGVSLDGATLAIASGGPGLPASVSSRVGQPFAKGPDSAGLGLGLSIVKRLCERDDIPMTVLDHGQGGMTVRLDLRLAPDPA